MNYIILLVFIPFVCMGVLAQQDVEDAMTIFLSTEDPGCSCTDILPPNHDFTCAEERDWGKCNDDWMVAGDFCAVSCNRCGNRCTRLPARGKVSIVETEKQECQCTDTAPPNVDLSCYVQRRLGKCPTDWMTTYRPEAPDGYCQYTCGRCPCDQAPDTRPLVQDTYGGEDGCDCTNIPPKGKPFTCEQQKRYGKCETIWMFDGPLKEGFCQITCGRCPCQPPPESTPPSITQTRIRFPMPSPSTPIPTPTPPLPAPPVAQLPPPPPLTPFFMGGFESGETHQTIILDQNFDLVLPTQEYQVPVPPVTDYMNTYEGQDTQNVQQNQQYQQQYPDYTNTNTDTNTESTDVQYDTISPTTDIQTFAVQCDQNDFNCEGNEDQKIEEANEPQECFPVIQIFDESVQKSFSKFQQLLQVSGYTSFLAAPVIPLTLFAPTNDAVEASSIVMGIPFEDMLQGQALAAALVRYHMIPAQFDLETLVISQGPFSTFESEGVLYFEKDLAFYSAEFTEYPGVQVIAAGNIARVIQSDIFGCNVFVHVLDNMLIPYVTPEPSQQQEEYYSEEQCSTVYEILQSRQDTEVYAAILESVPEVRQLFQNPNFQATVLVPTDQGVDVVAQQRNIDSAIFFQESAIALSIVSWSLVNDVVATQEIIEYQPYATLLSTFFISFQRAGDGWTVQGGVGDGAQIIEPNINACKSIVHIIDRLLIPSVQFQGTAPISPTTTETQRAFKQSFPELADLDLTPQNLNWIIDQINLLSPLNETQLFDFYKPRSQLKWLENLNKHLVLVGLSEEEIFQFEQRALEYLEGGEDPNSSVPFYRSFRNQEFKPDGIDSIFLSKDTLGSMNWTLDGQQAVSSVYVAMYDSVKQYNGDQQQECKSLKEVITNLPELSIIAEFLSMTQYAILDSQNGEDITLILPHNKAFINYFGSSSDLENNFLVQNVEHLNQYIEHVTAFGTYSTSQAFDAETINSVNSVTQYSFNSDIIQDFYGQPKESFVISYYGQYANIVRSVPQLCTGALHIIDQVILPENLL